MLGVRPFCPVDFVLPGFRFGNGSEAAAAVFENDWCGVDRMVGGGTAPVAHMLLLLLLPQNQYIYTSGRILLLGVGGGFFGAVGARRTQVGLA